MDKKRHQYLMHLDKHPHQMETNRNQRKRKQIMKKNAVTAEEAIRELYLTEREARELRYFIKRTPNLHQFHKQAKTKRIIYGLAILIRKKHRPNTYFKKLKACWNNNIDTDFLLTVSVNLNKYYQQSTPFCIDSTDYDHEILCRNGGKI